MELMFDYDGKAYRHNGDHDLMTSLGLRTWNFKREWTDLGTSPVFSGIAPATIKVEVSALPAQFWRFTIVRKDEMSEDNDATQTYILETGSGGFGEYWPTAKLIAENMLTVVKEEA